MSHFGISMELQDKNQQLENLEKEVDIIKNDVERIKDEVDSLRTRVDQLKLSSGTGCLPVIAIGLILYIGFHTIWKLPDWDKVKHYFSSKEILK